MQMEVQNLQITKRISTLRMAEIVKLSKTL